LSETEGTRWWTVPQAAVWIRTRDQAAVEALGEPEARSLAVVAGAIPGVLTASGCLREALRRGRLSARGRLVLPELAAATGEIAYRALDDRQGGRTCLSSLEMHPTSTLKRMCRQIVGSDRPTDSAIDAALDWAKEGLLVYELTGKQKLDELLEVFDYGRSRWGCDLFAIDSLMRLGVAGDDYNSQEAVIFRLVNWAMANAVHVHLVAHAKKGERERGVPGIEDIKGAMELGANAFNILSVWRNRKLEEAIAKLQAAGDREGAATLSRSKPGVVLNVAKQRNGDFEGKVGLWFDPRTYRYRSSADEATWKRTYLAEPVRGQDAARVAAEPIHATHDVISGTTGVDAEPGGPAI
jgi:hypothetical protein